MSVEFVPKKDGCFNFGVANATWFTLCNGPLKTFLGAQRTTDPMDVDALTADLCAAAIDRWEPPENWYSIGCEAEGKKMFQDFFRACGGFTTH